MNVTQHYSTMQIMHSNGVRGQLVRPTSP